MVRGVSEGFVNIHIGAGDFIVFWVGLLLGADLENKSVSLVEMDYLQVYM